MRDDLKRPRRYPELDPGLLLQGADDVEEILRTRVAVRREHAVQALARLSRFCRKPLEAARRVYEVAGHRLP